ncbi:glycosyltransferase [Nakamurella flavida]|uniref:Glycosyltransferase n=1 Tax=Nakamurella flavida TaxID=363630 RepID=A0A938YLP8_9ACTN|nr:glycosyltransferase [Nakamurella flavida]MBM9475707.1 glycosyltransferase [Nakamurella flavida]MDP9778015.1 glycosyltransferase involved in cell wall biosynthesis [Nakamurella flavida]
MSTRPDAGVGSGEGSIWITELDAAHLPTETHTISAPTTAHVVARVLIRVYGEPVGVVQRPLIGGRLDVRAALAALPTVEHDRLTALLAAGTPAAPSFPVLRRLTPEDGTPSVSVVVCTRNRGDALRIVLADLQGLDATGLPGGFEVVIVDNAPSDETGRAAFDAQVGQDSRFRYVREPRPGLSCARNRGLAEVRGPVIAYTDDDVRVDAGWLLGLARGFDRRLDVGCVTGMVCTATLDTAAERYFDARVSWSDGCTPTVYDASSHPEDPLYPYAAGRFGTGASMAFRTQVVRELGGFDEALGAGTATKGGEDLDIFLRILQGGYTLAYEPAALVWHRHRSDMAGLRKQIFGYGSGLTAYVTKLLLDSRSRRALLRQVGPGLAQAVRVTRSSKRVQGSAPAEEPVATAHDLPADGQVQALPPAPPLPTTTLRLRELAGMAMGPVLYFKACRHIPQATAATPVREKPARNEVA